MGIRQSVFRGMTVFKPCPFKSAEGFEARLMKAMGIPRPDDVLTMERTKAGCKPIKGDWFRSQTKKDRSTLHKWKCPESGLNVRSGKAGIRFFGIIPARPPLDIPFSFSGRCLWVKR